MSGNGTDVVVEVYRILGDNPNDPVVLEDSIRQAIGRWVNMIAGPVPPFGLNIGPVWISAALALVPSSRDYVFTSNLPSRTQLAPSPVVTPAQTDIEYSRLIELVYSRTKLPLRRMSRDEGMAGRALGNTSTGMQSSYWLEVNPDQTLQVCFPGYPKESETLDALVSVVPATWPIGPATAPVIPFSQTALRALELLVAASVGQVLSMDKLIAIGIGPSSFKAWTAEAVQLLKQERSTVTALKHTKGARNMEWVAGWVA